MQSASDEVIYHSSKKSQAILPINSSSNIQVLYIDNPLSPLIHISYWWRQR